MLPQQEAGVPPVWHWAEAKPEANTPAGQLEMLLEAAGCHRVVKINPLILEPRFNEFTVI